MEYVLRFANASALFVLLPAVALFVFLRLKLRKPVSYGYSLASELHKKKFSSFHKYRLFLFIIRFIIVFGIALLIGRPQLVDPKSNILVEGIDMVVALDASGSMQAPDQTEQNKTRFDVAKREAIRFIEKRKNDPMGLVIFGNDAISRCPITADKKILTSIVQDLYLGDINPQGTALATAILTAANRLKNSKSKTKIIILLTDGEPEGDRVTPETAVEVARRMGIKIYTIGIGPDRQIDARHPFFSMMRIDGVNKKLLTHIAEQTGGKFFLAQDSKQMRKVYETIDMLEKTEYETDIFSRYYELFMVFLWVIVALVFLELFLSTTIWFGL